MLTRLVSRVLPLACPGCGQPADPVCDTCATRLRPASAAQPPAGIDVWWAPFSYEDVARELVARVKYRGAHAVTAWLAEQMVTLLAPPLPPLVTWVPTTPRRRRERGFDHAELLAQHVARRIARPNRRLLTRGAGPAQTGLPAAARRRGPAVSARSAVSGSVLLVDDVATTGASLTAAAAALRGAGAAHVVALTAARTPAPGAQPAGRPGRARP